MGCAPRLVPPVPMEQALRLYRLERAKRPALADDPVPDIRYLDHHAPTVTKVRRYAHQGMTRIAIAAALGLSVVTVRKICQTNGILMIHKHANHGTR